MSDARDRLTAALADRYRLERELGAGGMATVYLAEDLKHGRRVAIKVLRPELAAVIGAERFLREIKTIATLQHPHILGLIDSGEAPGPDASGPNSFVYYVMPFVEGESLRDRLTREKQLPVGDAVRIATEVAGALDYAHRHGVIHRDIKPENILLHDGSALVADFGIALAVSTAGGGSRMTETGMSLGTPHYMSPEQAMGEREITARSDIFALGCVAYEMLVGEPPFAGPTAQSIVAKVMTEEPRPLIPQRRSVPPEVEDAVLTALEKLPADRFASAKAFAEALGNPGFRSSGSGAAKPAGQPGAATVWSPAFAGMTAVATVLLAALLWGRFGGRGAPTPTAAWRTTIDVPDSAPAIGRVALSPDGSVLVYDATGPTGTQLWTRRSDATEARPIPGTENGVFPAISPDGRRVAFKTSSANPKLLVVPLEGGTPTVATDTIPYDDVATWADNGHIVASNTGGLVRVAASGDASERLTTVDTAAGEGYHFGPQALPEGKGTLFVVAPKAFGAGTRKIAVVGPAGGRHTILMPGMFAAYAAPGHLLVLRSDGAIVAVPFDLATRRITGAALPVVAGLSVGAFSSEGFFSVSRSGRMVYVLGSGFVASDLVSVDRTGRAHPVDTSWRAPFQTVALSPDGTRLAAGLFTSTTEEIQVRNLADGSISRITSPSAQLRDPVFTPDGRGLVFAALAKPESHIDRANPGTELPPERIVTSTDFFATPLLSPDGKTLYYTLQAFGRSNVRAHRMDQPGAADRAVVDERNPQALTPSPDGRWLLYTADGPGGRVLYARSTNPARGERWEVGHGAGAPRWSVDGRTISLMASDTMYQVQVTGTDRFEGSAPRALFKTAGFLSPFDLFPDGRFLMIRKRTDSEHIRFVMADNWAALLPK